MRVEATRVGGVDSEGVEGAGGGGVGGEVGMRSCCEDVRTLNVRRREVVYLARVDEEIDDVNILYRYCACY